MNCEVCNYQTDRKANYERHLKSKGHQKKTNPELALHKCPTCEYSTKRKDNYTRHLLSHEETIKHKYKCLLCDTSFRDKTALKAHMSAEKHKKLVLEKPELTITKLVNGVPLQDSTRIDRTKTNKYLAKQDQTVTKKKRTKRVKTEEPEEEESNEFDERPYEDYHFNADKDTVKQLINNLIDWFKSRELEDEIDIVFINENIDTQEINELNDTLHNLIADWEYTKENINNLN